MHLLVEAAVGYTLFECIEQEQIALDLDQVQLAITEYSRFQKTVRMVSFVPFKNAAHALENMNDVSEGVANQHLISFLELNIKKSGLLGVGEPNLGGSIKLAIGVECVVSEVVRELIRGVRLHYHSLLTLPIDDISRAQLGLGHAYSRSKVKFNVNRVDNMITQSISLLDQLDKDVNTFGMRITEWYSWHFPELIKIVTDMPVYAQLVKFIKNKNLLAEESLPELEAITGDSQTALKILGAARSSMGTDISVIDMLNIQQFATRVIGIQVYRKQLHAYLLSKMHAVAPNMSALIGEIVGARLISHAGSLTNLAKYPASTLQILGAEKALFRALKTKGNTPKYGLIYHSGFITRAAQKHKGRISRVLANKVSIASRIDCFSELRSDVFGQGLRAMVEERLEFLESGKVPRKNLDVMAGVLDGLGDLAGDDDMEEDIKVSQQKAKKVRKSKKDDYASPVVSPKKRAVTEELPVKKTKKSKAAKEAVVEPVAVAVIEEPKKSKKSKKVKVPQEVAEEVAEVVEVKTKKAKKVKVRD